MHKKLFLFILLFSIGWTVRAKNDVAQQYWKEANEQYVQKQYQLAVENYEKLLSMQVSDDAVYYNLGNAYYRLRNIGKAVLNYERALVYNPNNKLAKENVDFIRKNTANAVLQLPDIFFIRWAKSFVAIASPNGWAWITAFCFLLIIAVLYLINTNRLRYGYRWLSLALALFVLSAAVTWAAFQHRFYHNNAVVMTPNVSLYEQAEATSKVKRNLPEGTTVTVLQERNQLLNVQLTDGSTGWIAKGDIEKI